MPTINVPLYGDDEWAQESHTALWDQPDVYSKVINGIKCLHESLKPRSTPRNPIIIRDEYPLLWNEIEEQSTSEHRGIVVWGQPGIGKTLFLRYAVGRALAKGMPCILCEQIDYFLYFDESGVRRITYGLNNIDIKLPSRIIALFDTNESMRSPHQYFLNSSCPAFVVQTTTPQNGGWYQWSKQLDARIWLIMPWTREEICRLDVLRPARPYHYTAVEIYDHLGPSPQLCCRHIPKTPDVERDFGLLPLSLDNPVQLLSQVQFTSIEGDDSHALFHQYFYAYRLPGIKSMLIHQAPSDWCEYRIPTQFLLRTLFRLVEKETLLKQQDLCRTLTFFSRNARVLDDSKPMTCLIDAVEDRIRNELEGRTGELDSEMSGVKDM